MRYCFNLSLDPLFCFSTRLDEEACRFLTWLILPLKKLVGARRLGAAVIRS